MFEISFLCYRYDTAIAMKKNIANQKIFDESGAITFLFGVVCLCVLVLFISYFIIAYRNRKKLLDAILEARQAEKQAIDANIEKTEIISKVAHDLKAPLKKISDIIEMADNNIDDPEKVQECHDKISLCVNKISRLIENEFDVINISKENQIQENEAFDIRALLNSCITWNRSSMNAVGATIELQHLQELAYPYLLGKPHYVKQIVSDILSNILQHNNPNAKIICSVKEEKHDKKKVVYTITITDSGWIMSEAIRRKIVDPFQADKKEAAPKAGLELAVVKKLVEQLQGEIKISSKEETGTIVSVTIPFEINMMMEKGNENEDVQITGLKVLLVEDNELNAEIAANKLEEAGAEVTIAENGQVAIDLFVNATLYAYDIILMDIVMPVMDGLTATKQIRMLDRVDAKQIPIIAMSSNTRDDDIEKAIDAGMNQYITKPIDTQNMYELVTLYEKLTRRSRNVARKAAIKKRLESLEYQAVHDSFTDVMNKNSFFDLVEIQLQENPNELHGMILFDLDNFKLVNDKLGHDYGDRVILHLANILKDKFRGADVIGRFGGDEFIIFMKNIKTPDIACVRASEVLKEVENSTKKHFPEACVTASAGVVAKVNIFSSQEMFKYADIALYKAKQNGKNQYHLYEKEE